jgi:hypothetical protein
MDNSKEFQLMLNKAIESESIVFKNFDRTKNVQDQLQEMMKDGLSTGIFGHTSGMVRYFEDNWRYRNQLGSDNMEQLWLAFVMFEHYQKIWNGTEWIKKGD